MMPMGAIVFHGTGNPVRTLPAGHAFTQNPAQMVVPQMVVLHLAEEDLD